MTIDVSEMEGLKRKFERMSGKAVEAIERKSALKINLAMAGHAKERAHVQTGNMRNMIDSNGFVERGPESVNMGITAHASYSIFEEYGTGYKGDPEVPHTSKKSWIYYDPAMKNADGTYGGFRFGFPREAHPFMRPALYDHLDEYKSILAGDVLEVFHD